MSERSERTGGQAEHSERGRRLRILHVILKVQPTNGQYNEHCLPLVHERDITVCSFLPAALTPPSSMTLFQGDGTVRGGWRALRSALDHQTYDVVHVHAPQTGALLLAMSAINRRSLANAVYTVQNSYRNYRLRNRVLMLAIFACYPRLVFCSESAQGSMSRLLQRLARSKSHVVSNGVDFGTIDDALDGRPADGEDITIISVGRLVPIKDPGLVLRAFAGQGGDGAKLVFVGDGELRAELEASAETGGVAGRVRFTGMLGRQDVYRELAAADIYVSASLGEGLPVAVLEAMACRCPVILSDIPPHRELAGGGGQVPLVAPGDTEGFVREIARLVAMTPDQRSELGARGREVVVRRFSLAVMHEAYVPVYAEAAAAAQV